MASPGGFALPPSDLNEFLFANIEVQPNGMPLTVLSQLARLGKDPWDEAERLAMLSYESAVSELSASIAVRPFNSLLPSAPETIATRLIALLPARNTITGIGIWA
jgi:hypothetical protein